MNKNCATCRHWWPHCLTPGVGRCTGITRKPVTGAEWGGECAKWQRRVTAGVAEQERGQA